MRINLVFFMGKSHLSLMLNLNNGRISSSLKTIKMIVKLKQRKNLPLNLEIRFQNQKMKTLNIIWLTYLQPWAIRDFQFKGFWRNLVKNNQFFKNKQSTKDILHSTIMLVKWESIRQMILTVSTSFLNTKN
jgi:hypothetical protein